MALTARNPARLDSAEMRTTSRRLTDGTIVLEQYSADHVNDLVAAVRESAAEVSPWLPWCHANYGAKDATEWLRRCAHAVAEGVDHQYAIRDATGRYVGGLGLRISDRQNGVASIGYWIRRSATRRGFATAAVRLAARFGFEELGLRRIEVFAHSANVASRRVAERAGARFEGIARNRILMHGVSHDAALYSIVPADLGAPPPTAGAR
jgi:ribosomal-protein-serine acetyltransferase